MVRIGLLLLFFAAVGCANVERPPTSPYDAVWAFDQQQLREDPYQIEFSVEESTDGTPQLIVSMELAEGAFYVSPHSSSRFTGRFSVSLYNDESVILDSTFIETPRSTETYDDHPFVGGMVNWVKEDTRYAYRLKPSTQNDFRVGGSVSFTIEPRCTFEEIPFELLSTAGEISVRRYPKLDNTSCPDKNGTKKPTRM